jgi:maleylpyruvate isomerase
MTHRADLATDPSVKADLLLARHGQAYFSRVLNQLTDADLDGESTRPGVSRRQVIAEVGLQARLLANHIGYMAVGSVDPESEPLETSAEWNAAVALATTLPAHALRYLNAHSAVHLNVAWRDLKDENWSAELALLDGQMVPMASTPWLRAKHLWVGSLVLHGGGRREDVPPALTQRLGAPGDDRSDWLQSELTKAVGTLIPSS